MPPKSINFREKKLKNVKPWPGRSPQNVKSHRQKGFVMKQTSVHLKDSVKSPLLFLLSFLFWGQLNIKMMMTMARAEGERICKIASSSVPPTSRSRQSLSFPFASPERLNSVKKNLRSNFKFTSKFFVILEKAPNFKFSSKSGLNFFLSQKKISNFKSNPKYALNFVLY